MGTKRAMVAEGATFQWYSNPCRQLPEGHARLHTCWRSIEPSTLFKQAEVYAAVGAVLYEIGMGGEVVVLAVLKHEETIGGE